MRLMTTLSKICRTHGITLADLAARIGRSRDTIKKYGQPGRKIPPELVPVIVRALDGKVSPSELRPDVFTPTDKAA